MRRKLAGIGDSDWTRVIVFDVYPKGSFKFSEGLAQPLES